MSNKYCKYVFDMILNWGVFMIEKRLVDYFKGELGLSDDNIEVAVFGYRLFLYSILGYILIGLVAYLLNTVRATLIAAITASVFRIFSGGAHASSQNKCLAVGTIIFNIIGLVATAYYKVMPFYLLDNLFWITAVTALIIFIIYAPADTPGKPITSKVQRYKFKSISIVLLIFWVIFFKLVFKGETNIYKLYYLASILGLLWQSISLLPITYKLIIFK